MFFAGERFATEALLAGGIEELDGFEVSKVQMKSHGLTAANVLLLTEQQAEKLFRSCGLTEVRIVLFLLL